jgi:C4-dicarboxylate transporter DctM subunit
MSVGINPIHFGVIMVMNMTIGLITPPLGINLFVAQGLDKRAPFSKIIKNVTPLFLGEVLILLLVTFIPDLALLMVNALR